MTHYPAKILMAFACTFEPEQGDGTVACRVVSPTYNCGFSRECKAVSAVFSVRKLPKDIPFRMAVYPRNCFGGPGRPIRTAIWSSV